MKGRMSKTKPGKGTETTPHTHGRRIPKGALWLGAGAVAAAIGGFILLGPAGPGAATNQETPHVTSIASIAPADSDTFVIAPDSKEWWAKVTLMTSPEMLLAELDPEAAGVSIDNIGYSRSPDRIKRDVPMTGPLRLFYAESSSPEAALKVAKWLKEAAGFEGRRVHLSGNIVIVGPSWVADYAPPTESLAKVPGYAMEITSGTAAMWRNVDQEVPALVGDMKSPRAEVMATVLSKGYGFTSGTTWVGTSKGDDSWSGAFKSGGVNPAQLDFKATQSSVMGTQKVLDSVQNRESKWEFLDSGMTELLTDASFVAPSQPQRLGGPMPENIPRVKDAVITAVTDPTGVNSAATGISGSLENVATQAVSANKHEMIVSISYNK
jgi:hypothetical protein